MKTIVIPAPGFIPTTLIVYTCSKLYNVTSNRFAYLHVDLHLCTNIAINVHASWEIENIIGTFLTWLLRFLRSLDLGHPQIKKCFLSTGRVG